MRIPLELETGQAQAQMDNFAQKAAKDLSGNLNGAIDKAGQLAGAFGTIGKTIDKFPSTFGDTGKEMQKVSGLVGDAASQAKDWAAAGAAFGSIIPGVGTVVGGLVGTAASVGLSIWDWATGASETEKNLKLVEDIQKRIHDNEAKAAYARWEAIKRERAAAEEAFNSDAIKFIATGVVGESLKNLGLIEKELPPVVRPATNAIDEQAKALATLNSNALALLQTLDTSTPKIDAFERFLASPGRGVVGTGSRSTTHAGPRVAPGVVDGKEAQRKYDEQVAMYESYVGKVTSITGELTAQLESNIAAGEKLFTGFGAAAERGVSQVLKALAKEFSVKAIGEVAEGFASLGKKDVPGATAHFVSAGKFGAAATAAGIGGAVTGGDASRRDAGREDAGGGGLFSPSDSRITDPGTQDLRPVVINFNSVTPPTEREAQNAANQVDSLLKKRRR